MPTPDQLRQQPFAQASVKTERIHGLDSLRAIMMMLGIVIPAAVTYSPIEYPAWTIKDSAAVHGSMHFIAAFIHLFRMPLFFVIAGFFGALLFYQRSPRAMIKNRLERLVYPFIVFVLLLWPTIVFTFGYSRAVFAGSETPLAVALESLASIAVLLPAKTFHLWFLYYLMWITGAVFVLAMAGGKFPGIAGQIQRPFDWIIQRPFSRLGFFAGLTFLVLQGMQQGWVATSTAWVPDPKTFAFYSFFYLCGWALYKAKHLLTSTLTL